MKKQSLRSFAIGMLLSASMLGSYYFYQESKSQEQFSLNVPDATTFLQKEGFIILSDSEYKDMQKTIEQSKQDQAKSDVEANEKKQEESKEEKQ
ncbi:MAG: hypothetical protein ABTA16_08670, partial [Niallia sp.]